MRGGRQRLRSNLLLLVAGVAVGLAIVAYATGVLRSTELDTVDTRFSVRGEREPPEEIVVVGVDARAFQAVQQRWPFTHDVHARVVDRLRRDGAKLIVLDIQFSEPSSTDSQSVALLDSLAASRRVVVSTTEVDDLGNGNAFFYYVPVRVARSKRHGAINRFLRGDLGVSVGHGGVPRDPGGIIRRFYHEADGLESLDVAAAERVTGKQIDRSEFDDDGTAWIDYVGGPERIKTYSYADVYLKDRLERGTFRDKIVVVGATATSLQDIQPTSTSGEDEMPGPEIHANAIETLLGGFPLGESPVPLDVVLIVLLGIAAPAASLRFSAIPAFFLALALGAAYLVAAQLLFDSGTIVPVVYPLGALVLSAVGALGVYYLTEAIERERTRDLFSRFVPVSVVGQVLEQADGARLGGVGREATVMFSDLRGFTSFAESLEPDQVITILNRYLTAMVDDAIDPHGGTLVDYMGDGIMAVFGAPIEMDDHADRALAGARAKLRQLERFNEWLRAEMGFEKSFQMGIGLNSGRVMSGNVGSERRLAYTAIGDTTNTAARLEAMTKDTPYMILLSDSTRELLSEEPSDLIFFEEVEVRGRQQNVKLWSVTDSRKQASADESFQSVAAKDQPA